MRRVNLKPDLLGSGVSDVRTAPERHAIRTAILLSLPGWAVLLASSWLRAHLQAVHPDSFTNVFLGLHFVVLLCGLPMLMHASSISRFSRVPSATKGVVWGVATIGAGALATGYFVGITALRMGAVRQ